MSKSATITTESTPDGGAQQDQNRGLGAQSNEVNVLQRLEDLETREKQISTDFSKLETSMGRQQNLTSWVVGAMALGFVFTNILIVLDYFKYNDERYAYFTDKIQNSYAASTDVIDARFQDFKNCIWTRGLSACLK
jgi:hypothetical protein